MCSLAQLVSLSGPGVGLLPPWAWAVLGSLGCSRGPAGSSLAPHTPRREAGEALCPAVLSLQGAGRASCRGRGEGPYSGATPEAVWVGVSRCLQAVPSPGSCFVSRGLSWARVAESRQWGFLALQVEGTGLASGKLPAHSWPLCPGGLDGRRTSCSGQRLWLGSRALTLLPSSEEGVAPADSYEASPACSGSSVGSQKPASCSGNLGYGQLPLGLPGQEDSGRTLVPWGLHDDRPSSCLCTGPRCQPAGMGGPGAGREVRGHPPVGAGVGV